MASSETRAGHGRARVARRQESATPELWALLDAVRDPEIPVLSIWDLGVLQDVCLEGDTVTVAITPTYSGCPAMREIERDIRARLADAGYAAVRVERRLSPAWTSDWLSGAGREALLDFGIAPPCRDCGGDDPAETPACPQCGSDDTGCISEFGSTACKALYRCNACMEPFDHFKRF